MAPRETPFEARPRCPRCHQPGCFLWRVVQRHTPLSAQPRLPMLDELLDAVLRAPGRKAQLGLLDDYYLLVSESGCSTAMGVVSDALATAAGITLP